MVHRGLQTPESTLTGPFAARKKNQQTKESPVATAISELKAPPGVSRDKMYQELVRKERKEKRAKVEEESMWGRVTTIGTGAAVATISGALVARFPRIASFDAAGKIQTRPIVGAALIIAGFFADDLGADALSGAGMGLTLPFLSEWGGRIAGQIGG